MMKNMNDLFTFIGTEVITKCPFQFNDDYFPKGAIVTDKYAEFLIRERRISVWIFVESL